MSIDRDEEYMAIALAEAIKGKKTVAENPMVGALIVEDNEIVAKGYHVRPGELHAERIALDRLRRKPNEGAEMYVTLEPCSTTGRTGKCTQAIIDSGIKTVIVGTIDPNPVHQGRGIEKLKNAGVEVRVGVLEERCIELIKEFSERMKNA